MPGPRTRNGLDVFVCLSAMQKAIRRGLEREAMEFAVGLIHSGKSFTSMVCNRLEVISHEDIGLADPFAVLFVRCATA
jgi:replication-associated recombination protein RarA